MSAMAAVIELEVTAAQEAGHFQVRVVRPASGQGSAATMQLDVTAFSASRDDLEAAVLASAVAGRRVLSPGERRLRGVGQELFDALFSGPVGETYRSSVAAAGSRGERLQVVLQLEAPELAALPWESMYDAENDEYIGLTDPLIRHLPSTDAEPLELAPPLRVLVIVASPDGMTTLDVEAERSKLSDALAEPIADGRIELTWLMQATWEQVQDEMLSGTWHVLHFIGHGDYDPGTDQGVIALVADDGGLHLVEADRLAGLLNEARPTPRLVVLNSCQSGRSGSRDLFSSTAATLVRRGISAVAAMQFSISDAGATKFARGLYRALASGRTIGDAMGSGRVGLLSTPGSLEWVTPVLYVRGDTGPLFTITGPPPAPVPAVRTPTPTPTATPAGVGGRRWALIGGAAAAAAVGVVTTVVLLSSPKQSPAPPETATPTASTTAVSSAPKPGGPRSVIRALDAAGVNTTLPGGEDELAGYLANPRYTPYPAVAQLLLRLIGNQTLRQPVPIDAIVFDYEELAGTPPPNDVRRIDVDTLERAVVVEYASTYGERPRDFASLLVPRG